MAFKKNDERLSNFLPINRKLFEHPFWVEKRPYSRFEAWLDLIKEARFEDTDATMLIGNSVIKWNRGEIPASLRYLSERWEWSKNKVDNFLEMLETEGMITKRTAKGTSQTIITLCNYDTYNTILKNKGQQKGQDRDSTGTASGQDGDKSNNTNRDNKENKLKDADASTPTIEEEKLFEGFKRWISENAPRVSEMKEPFTIQQYLSIRKKLSKDVVKQIIVDMHNWEPLIKKNRSAYLTILKWNRMQKERGSDTIIQKTQNGNSVKAGIYAARQKEENIG